jgi:hypothetical protein
MRRKGSFGVLPAEIATSLVMVLNELLLNAVEHGFPAASAGEEAEPAADAAPDLGGAAGPEPDRPEVVVSAHRFRKQLHVSVTDNGRGLPAEFDAESGSRLGLQIVRALATGSCAAASRRNRRRWHRGGPRRPTRPAPADPAGSPRLPCRRTVRLSARHATPPRGCRAGRLRRWVVSGERATRCRAPASGG